MKAGFGRADITPALPCSKVGWIKDIRATNVLDPLHATALVLESGGRSLGFVSIDTLSVRRQTVALIREGITRLGFPGDNVMVSATHNHAGPAVCNEGDVKRDDAYLEFMTGRVIDAFRQALESRRDAEAGFGRAVEMSVAVNRRIVYRDGLVRTHGSLDNPDALFVEGPVDPEVSVMVIREPGGHVMGATVNYSLHPTFHGDDEYITANWPGAMAGILAGRGVPVTMYLQGAQGNISVGDPLNRGANPGMEEVGRVMADAVERAIRAARFTEEPDIRAASEVLALPYRTFTEDELHGRIRGAQRFVDPEAYERAIPWLLRKSKDRGGVKRAQVQALAVGGHTFVGIPAEFFVQNGLAIKEGAYPAIVHVVLANGMLGYIPHLDAFKRGGYETTLTPGVDMAPETGDLLVAAALRVIKSP